FELARLAVEEAMAEANIAPGALDGPLFLAAPPVEMDWRQRLALYSACRDEDGDGYRAMLAATLRGAGAEMFDDVMFGTIASRLSDLAGARGLPITLSTACASGATAIQLAVEAIRRGECDRALAIGADGSGS